MKNIRMPIGTEKDTPCCCSCPCCKLYPHKAPIEQPYKDWRALIEEEEDE